MTTPGKLRKKWDLCKKKLDLKVKGGVGGEGTSASQEKLDPYRGKSK